VGYRYAAFLGGLANNSPLPVRDGSSLICFVSKHFRTIYRGTVFSTVVI
jgi:hypothetical protein